MQRPTLSSWGRASPRWSTIWAPTGMQGTKKNTGFKNQSTILIDHGRLSSSTRLGNSPSPWCPSATVQPSPCLPIWTTTSAKHCRTQSPTRAWTGCWTSWSRRWLPISTTSGAWQWRTQSALQDTTCCETSRTQRQLATWKLEEVIKIVSDYFNDSLCLMTYHFKYCQYTKMTEEDSVTGYHRIGKRPQDGEGSGDET